MGPSFAILKGRGRGEDDTSTQRAVQKFLMSCHTSESGSVNITLKCGRILYILWSHALCVECVFGLWATVVIMLKEFLSFEITGSVERCRGWWNEETLLRHIARCVGMKGGILHVA